MHFSGNLFRRRSPRKGLTAVLAAWAMLVMTGSTEARGIHDLMQAGYQVIWSGYAAVTTCVHGQDHYDFGDYLFICDQYTYDYPYHYGDIWLSYAGRGSSGRSASAKS